MQSPLTEGSEGTSWPCWLHIGAATTARVLITSLGLARPLQQLIVVETPLTSLVRLREALWLVRLGRSPYTGSAYHAPPLLLPLLAPFIDHPIMYILPYAAADAASAWLLCRVAASFKPQRVQNNESNTAAGGRQQPVSPTTIAALYLWSPVTIMACCGGSLGAFENLAVYAAVYNAVVGNAPLAAFAAVCAGYLSLHPLLEVLPLALLLAQGAEDLNTVAPPIPAAEIAKQPAALTAAHPAAGSFKGWRRLAVMRYLATRLGVLVASTQAPASGGSTIPQQPSVAPQPSPLAPTRAAAQQSEVEQAQQRQRLQQRQQPRSAASSSRGISSGRLINTFLGFCVLWAAALVLLSDLALQQYPEHACSGVLGWPLRLWQRVRFGAAVDRAGRCTAVRALSDGRHWMQETYGFLLKVEDLAPNMGMHWYFFAEAFPSLRTVGRLVFQLIPAALAVPLALKFRRRPLLLVLLQSLALGFMKPYPSLADLAQYLALLPLFRWQLEQLAGAQFLATAFLLLAALAPAMWHMWIYVGSANANFFYAITLLFGAWQAVVAVQLVLATRRHDRLLAGKPC